MGVVSTIYHTCVHYLPHFRSDSGVLATSLEVKSEGPMRWPGFLSLTYYLNYTRLVRTAYQLSVGAKLLMIGLLRGGGKNSWIAIRCGVAAEITARLRVRDALHQVPSDPTVGRGGDGAPGDPALPESNPGRWDRDEVGNLEGESGFAGDEKELRRDCALGKGGVCGSGSGKRDDPGAAGTPTRKGVNRIWTGHRRSAERRLVE
jgi:hypothetical protein